MKRIHEYKRQLMNALHALMLYFELRDNLDSRKVSRQLIFAGKAAPGYEVAKQIIHLIYIIAKKVNQDPNVNSKLRVTFVENYNVSKAEVLIPAADISEQISTAGTEASGTGNMKLAMNGALTVGTEDGANIEMHKAVGDARWPFSFGSSAVEIQSLKESGTYSPWTLYSQEEKIRRVLDALKDGSLGETEEDHEVLGALHTLLLQGVNGKGADPSFSRNDNNLFLTRNAYSRLHKMTPQGFVATNHSRQLKSPLCKPRLRCLRAKAAAGTEDYG